jgi:putative ABC transport system permease protein
MQTLPRDIRFGLRMLVKNPGFSLIAVITLALGVGSTTAIFSVVNAVLLRALPISDASRVVVLHNNLPKLSLPLTEVSPLQYLEYTSRTDVFDSTAATGGRSYNLTGVDTPERLSAGRATASFFPLLGINPVAGRLFTEEEDKFGSPRVAVLSQGLWKRLFNSDPSAVGRTLQLDGEGFEVIGVVPAGVEEVYPNRDIWIPMAFSPGELSEQRRWSLYLTMLGRMRAGVGLQQAQAAMTSVAGNMSGDQPDGFGISVRPLVDERLGDVRKPLYVLLGGVVIVLLIACANIANLLLARAGGRSREIAIRSALGAQRGRIVRQLLTESMLLGVAGGSLGVLIASWGTSALIAIAPADLPRLSEVRLDSRVLLFSLAVSLASGIFFGLVPALAASRIDLVSSLKESGRSDSANLSRHRLSGVLVVGEVALAFVLLISAGLLLRSFIKLLEVRPGFDPNNVLTMRVSLPRSQYGDRDRVAGFYNSVLDRISAVPGVANAAVAFQPPFTPGSDNSVFLIRDRREGPDAPPPHADYLYVTPDYFHAMRIPLLRGRLFEPADMRSDGPFGPGSAVIVDEAFAKRYWPDGDALGGGVGWGGPWGTVVGIVGTVYAKDLVEEPKGTVYLPWYLSSATFVVRTNIEPAGVAAAIREQVSAVDRNQPVYDVKTMEERLAGALEARRFGATLLGIFAVIALALAAIGLYGVISYLVSQRRHEIGIRMALGARGVDVVGMILGHGLKLVLIGEVIGIAAAYGLTRLMTSLLFGVAATDIVTFALVSGVLLAVAALGCYIPARRGAGVDPMVALRNE